jgi:SAM-dependent methyltransferase
MNRKSHWENVYQTKDVDQVSWYREHLENSIDLILETKVGKEKAIIDIGGGSSTLADDLLKFGFFDITVLDISAKALENSRRRLGKKAESVKWLVADITETQLPQNHFDVWHDRAVFHFLTDAKDRRKYAELVRRSITDGGHIIVASFGLGGPKKCSGLDVVRYSPESLQNEFGEDFELVKTISETHATPSGSTQEFIYCLLRKLS